VVAATAQDSDDLAKPSIPGSETEEQRPGPDAVAALWRSTFLSRPVAHLRNKSWINKETQESR
jgi:hypothetical protein